MIGYLLNYYAQDYWQWSSHTWVIVLPRILPNSYFLVLFVVLASWLCLFIVIDAVCSSCSGPTLGDSLLLQQVSVYQCKVRQSETFHEKFGVNRMYIVRRMCPDQLGMCSFVN